MRILLIEDNAFIAFDIQSHLNYLGVFSIMLYAEVEEVLLDLPRSKAQYDVILLRKSLDPQQDLTHVWRLHKELGVERVFLTGVYSDLQRRNLLHATTSLKLPLKDILRLPLEHAPLQMALLP